jgi:hypothetical protein
MAIATTRGLRLSRRVEARTSRLFETRVFARNCGRSRGETAVRESPRDQGVMLRKLAQDRANRSKRAKVIYRRIDMFEQTRLLPAWDADFKIRPYIGFVESICARRWRPTVHRNSASRNEAQSET